MIVKVGSRLKSQVGAAEFIVVRAPGDDVDLRSGGVDVLAFDAPAAEAAVVDGFAEPVQLGKRYVDAADTLEVLVTKSGPGALSVGDEVLDVKQAKPLPSSD